MLIISNRLRQSLQAGYISEPAWLKALDDRNKTSHAYDETMAKEITNLITEHYFYLLKDLYLNFKKES
jgi:hypothetical protein